MAVSIVPPISRKSIKQNTKCVHKNSNEICTIFKNRLGMELRTQYTTSSIKNIHSTFTYVYNLISYKNMHVEYYWVLM